MRTFRITRFASICLAAALALCLCFAFAAMPNTAFANDNAPAQVSKQVKGKNITGKANTKTLFRFGWHNQKNYTATSKTIKKYDITGDKKADKIKIKVSGAKDDGYGTFFTKALVVYVNGKKLKTIPSKNGEGFTASVQLLTLKNGKSFLYVEYYGNNEDGTYALYQYRSGKIKTILTDSDIPAACCTHHHKIDSIKPLSNKIVMTYAPQTYFAAFTYIKYSFPYSSKLKTLNLGNGKKLAKVGTVYTGKNYSTGKYFQEELTASIEMPAYTTKGLSTKAFTVKEGQTVTFKKAYVNKSKKLLAYYVTCEGKSGWLRPYTVTGPTGGTCFEEKQLAG
ncbi:MAG: hypothetical protein Q4D27_07885 [Coriobacteriia bacterium]|nr:hypothetical protein [Coriobacteriia bacterium]